MANSPKTRRSGPPVPRAIGLFLFAGGLLLFSGCATPRAEVVAYGWAWPLPPLSMRSPAFIARARRAADLDRLQRAMPWAGSQITGRGSAAMPRDVQNPVIASLLRQVQARETARRVLADRIAALPMPNTADLRGPVPHVGDPGRLTPDQQKKINDLIAHAPVVSDTEVTGGRVEAQVSLRLDNVARVLLNEPVVDETPAPAPATGEKTAASGSAAASGDSSAAPKNSAAAGAATSAPPSAAGRSGDTRTALPSIGESEYVAAARFAAASDRATSKTAAANGEKRGTWDPRTASPQAKVEAQRRAEGLARQWLWETIRQRPMDDGTPLGHSVAVLPSIRLVVQNGIQNAPVRSVVWDELGRCRVAVALDWTGLLADIKAQNSLGLGGSQNQPMPLP